jgi:hypothetical protein
MRLSPMYGCSSNIDMRIAGTPVPPSVVGIPAHFSNLVKTDSPTLGQDAAPHVEDGEQPQGA